jgi:hypothetical protein
MKRSTAFLLCLSLTSSVLSIGCTAPNDVDVEDDDSDATEESEVGTAESALMVGGVDLTAQCKRQYGQSAYAVLTQPQSSPGVAYAWRCQVGSSQYGIDVDAACRAQYGATAFGRAADVNNAYSWQCWTPTVCDRDNDGCSVPYNLSTAYKGQFGGACVGHDRCYSTPGASKGTCDTDFRNAMKGTCYHKGLFGETITDPICLGEAEAYYQAVKNYPSVQSGFNQSQQDVAQCTHIYDHDYLFWVR